MWKDTLVRRLADRALALFGKHRADCAYGDIRFVDTERRSAGSQNGAPSTNQDTSRGFGIRILARDGAGRAGFGFAASSLLDGASVTRTFERALANARANQVFQPADAPALSFEGSTEQGTYQTPVEQDPFAVPLGRLEARVTALDKALKRDRVIARSAFIRAERQDKRFFASSGAALSQLICVTGAGVSVTVNAEGVRHHQTRSHQAPGGIYNTGGLELVDRMELEASTETIWREAQEILRAPECPAGRATVVLGPQALGLLVHEVAGHALELDRALGWEAAYAGRSFLKTEGLGSFRYGTPLVNIVSDPTFPGAVATCGWDDEGTPSRRAPLIERGVHVGYLCGRSDAHYVDLASCGAARSSCWSRQPIDRMTNVNLLPGTGPTAAELIASVEHGLYLESPCGWSINSDRNGFRFSMEIARRIEGGRLGAWVRNGAYRASTTPEFWSKCRALASDPPWVVGFNSCAKGQPVQLQFTGHVVPQAALFEDVEVGEHGTVA